MKDYLEKIFEIKTENNFEELAVEAFRIQYKNNKLYSQYVDYLGINPDKVNLIKKIPFLPIQFFKSHKIITKHFDQPDNKFVKFLSSGTTELTKSTHYVYSTQLYEKSFISAFRQLIGEPNKYTILALLPSYLNAGNSSLVYMVDKLIKLSNNPSSGFFLDNYQELSTILKETNSSGKKVILFGVTYALLELAEKYNINLSHTTIIETGGMKGRGEELTRAELHHVLKEKFSPNNIYSEYGMTELLSQAYSLSNELFTPSKTMKVLIRDVNDPFSYIEDNKTGGVNIIDLVNIYSCCFIETKDLGKSQKSRFEVLGRFDNSDLRGCNMLIH